MWKHAGTGGWPRARSRLARNGRMGLRQPSSARIRWNDLEEGSEVAVMFWSASSRRPMPFLENMRELARRGTRVEVATPCGSVDGTIASVFEDHLTVLSGGVRHHMRLDRICSVREGGRTRQTAGRRREADSGMEPKRDSEPAPDELNGRVANGAEA